MSDLSPSTLPKTNLWKCSYPVVKILVWVVKSGMLLATGLMSLKKLVLSPVFALIYNPFFTQTIQI